MVVGYQGNTGTQTTASHVDVEYSVWDARTGGFETRDPSSYFGVNNFQQVTQYASEISGLQNQLSNSDIMNVWRYAQSHAKTDPLDFQAFRTNPMNQQRFGGVDWQLIDRSIYTEMLRRSGR
jgi:hypothetical protein